MISDSVTIYPVPVADFLLVRIEPPGRASTWPPGGHLLIATAGEVQVDDGSGPREIAQGDAVFIAAGSTPVQVRGPGIAHVATVNAATG